MKKTVKQNRSTVGPDFLDGSYIAFQKEDYVRYKLLYNILRLGHVVGGKKFGFSRADHDVYGLIYVQQGAAVLQVNEKEISVKEGDLLFFNMLEEHLFRNDGDIVIFDFIFFFGPNVQSFWDSFHEKYGYVCKNYDPALFLQTIAALAPAIEQKADSPYVSSAEIYRLLTDILSYCGEPQYSEHDVSAAVEYIKTHYNEPFNLDQLASLVCMNKYDFIRQFCAQTDKTPKQYHLDQRAQAGRTLLKNTDLSIRKIAEMVGYADTRGFIALFRQTEGMTPSQWRASDREEFFEKKRRLAGTPAVKVPLDD